MRIRAMTASGDMSFGQGGANFLVNSPAAVRQLVQTRLLLWSGEWFLDQTEGTPYSTRILGNNTQNLYDDAITQRILDTQGVVSLSEYQSQLDRATRVLTVQARAESQFGATNINLPVQGVG